MCSYFKVSRSGYYKWRKRRCLENKDHQIAKLVEECEQENNFCYGYRRVKIWLLKKYGLNVNHKKVLRIMNEYSLLSRIRRKRYYKRYHQGILRYKNILKRNFKATKPNQKWVTDITYIKTKQGNLFLSIIKDLYDKYIVGYSISKNQKYSLVDKTIRSALKNTNLKDGVILHSDQGFQYTSFKYHKITSSNNIITSMSKPGTPIDNSPAESFFSTLKTECINRQTFYSFSQAIDSINDYIYYYNHHRLQLSTGMSPFDYRQSYLCS